MTLPALEEIDKWMSRVAAPPAHFTSQAAAAAATAATASRRVNQVDPKTKDLYTY